MSIQTRAFQVAVVSLLVAATQRASASDCNDVRPGECFCNGFKQDAVIGHFDIIDDVVGFRVQASFSRTVPPKYAVGERIVIDPQMSFDSRSLFLGTETEHGRWVFDLVAADGTLTHLGSEPDPDGRGPPCTTRVDALEVAAFTVSWSNECESAAQEALQLTGGRDCEDASSACNGGGLGGAASLVWLLGLALLRRSPRA